LKPLLMLPNHTQVPNEFIDKRMRDLSGAALKCFLLICRKTIGWHKLSDAISYSQIKDITGLSNEAVTEGLKKLVDERLISVHKSPGQSTRFDILFDTSPEIGEVEKGTSPKTGEHLTGNRCGTSPKTGETKDISQKKLEKKLGEGAATPASETPLAGASPVGFEPWTCECGYVNTKAIMFCEKCLRIHTLTPAIEKGATA
jgi:phage replication O-like protein O